MGLYIGIDGGGTHSTAAAAWPNGRIAAVTEGQGLNYHNVGVEPVRKRLEEMVRKLEAQAGAPTEKICVGMSALDGPADEATLALFTAGALSPTALDLQSDAYAALMGFTQGEPGMIVICGTGSMLLVVDENGNQHVSGGWGYLLNDAGSGYTLAREALLRVIDAAEGTGPSTPLTALALDYFGVDSPRRIIDRVYAPDFTPDKLAGFAPCVISQAEQGEPVALEEIYLPYNLIPGLDEIDIGLFSLYDAMGWNGIHPHVGQQTLRVTKLEPSLARLIDLSPEQAVMEFSYLIRDAFGRTVEFSRSWIRGDRTEFYVHFSDQPLV